MTSTHLLMTSDAIGGVWTYTLDLAAALAGHGVRTTIATLGPSPSDDQRRSAAGIPGLRLVETAIPLDWCAQTPAQVHDASTQVYALARRVRANLVQLHSPALAVEADGSLPTMGLIHSCQASWWATMEGGPMPEDFVWRTDLVAHGLARCAQIVAPSHAFAALVQRCYGLARPPRAVHNGRSIHAVSTRAPDDSVFTAGRLWDRAKNAKTMDDAAARLAVPFKAAGQLRSPGGDGVDLRHLCLLGQMENEALAALLSARPVFVSAALYEPFGLSVLEAAMAGCALVLSDIPTFRELWDDAALFVSPRDAQGFADAIEALIGDPAARHAMGARAARRAQSYSITSTARQMAGLYAELLPRSRRDAA